MNASRTILMTAIGSHGDVLPQIAIGQALKARGHRVELFVSAFFAPLVEAAGLTVHPGGTVEEYLDLLRNPDTHHPIRAFRRFAELLGPYCLPMLEEMRARVEPGNTILVTGILGVVPRLLQEIDGIPCVTLHTAPAGFRSRHQVSRMLPYDSLPHLPGWMRPPMWWLSDLLLDPAILPMVNPARAKLGLPPVQRFFHRWVHGATRQLAMFPQWFAEAQPDWPSNTRLTGFPLPALQADQALPEAVQRFLDAGPPPVAFSAGTATAANREFFEISAEACRQSGRRGILLTHRPEQLPATLPEGVVHFDYVSFDALLPRVAAFVHHGGIGSTAQALRAGVPQLIRPMAFDQFDNSIRAQRLGVAAEILPGRYRPARVAAALAALIDDPAVRLHGREQAQRLAGEDGVAAACEAILAVAV